MRVGRLPNKLNKRQFRRKASHVNARNIFNPRKLHKGGEIVR